MQKLRVNGDLFFHNYFRNFKVKISKLDAPSLELFKVKLDGALSNLI